ncbi:Uma2 family endonuclease [Amycolatopsis taiwanensis]|uniref:Uma2 family endonuclease n=1 Tax=Amycolatopsis taiwanensis TaxID=342230 RepID=UPI0004BC38A8|nr:Uma2 family endonuclease [Amycolatopsis taiwanensis]
MAASVEAEVDYVVPKHRDPWTVDEVLALPDDNGDRVELLDGALLVSPAPTSRHQRLLGKLYGLRDAVPAGTEMLLGVNVRLGEDRLLIPDLVVVTCPDVDVLYYSGPDVLLAAEIESPSTKVFDRSLKAQLYAEARISYYLRVDPATDPVEAILFELSDGEFREIARSEAGKLTVDRPFAATVDLT